MITAYLHYAWPLQENFCWKVLQDDISQKLTGGPHQVWIIASQRAVHKTRERSESSNMILKRYNKCELIYSGLQDSNNELRVHTPFIRW